MGKLFESFELKPNFDFLKDAGNWVTLLMEAVGTALWIIVATQAGNNGWAWGLSFVVISLAFPGYCFNTLTDLMSMLRGETNMVRHLFTALFHCLGAIAAHMLAGNLGLGSPSVPAHGLTFLGDSGAFTANFHKFFFGHEFVGLFLFTCFSAKATSDMPSSLWSMLMIGLAFWLGGDNFVFFPARLFNNFQAFASAGTWAGVVCQGWSVIFANVVLEYIWKDW